MCAIWIHDKTARFLREIDLIISGETAYACFDRLSTRAGTSLKSTARAEILTERDILSTNQLIGIARQLGFEARLMHLDWRGLQTVASADPILLLLRSGNIVIARRNGGDPLEQIVVSNPVYRDGQEFLRSRSEVEAEWSGTALLVKPGPVTSDEVRGKRFVSGLGCCAGAVALGLLLFDVEDVRPLAVMQQLFGSEMTPRNHSDVTSISLFGDLSVNGIHDAMLSNESGGRAHRSQPGPNMEDPMVGSIQNWQFSAHSEDHATNSAIHGGDRTAEMSTHPPSLFEGTGSDGAQPSSNPGAEEREALLQNRSDAVATNRLENLDTSEKPNVNKNVSAVGPVTAVAVLRGKSHQVISKGTSKIENDQVPPESTAGASKELAPASEGSANMASGERTASTELLIARGDAFLGMGDVTSARLFYEWAANAGEGQAALRMGESYDPAFLAATRVPGIRGDPSLAAQWYLRALELGTLEAEGLLRAVTAKGGYSAH